MLSVSLLRRPPALVAALGPVLLLALLPALLLTLDAGLALLLLTLETRLALHLLALDTRLALLLALNARRALPLLLALDTRLVALLLLALDTELALGLLPLLLYLALLVLALGEGLAPELILLPSLCLLPFKLCPTLGPFLLLALHLCLALLLLAAGERLTPLGLYLPLLLLAAGEGLVPLGLYLLLPLPLEPLLLDLLLASDLAALTGFEALACNHPPLRLHLRLLLADQTRLLPVPEGLPSGRGRQHRTTGHWTAGRRRHPGPLHLRPEELDLVVREARAPVALASIQVGDLIARHAAIHPLDAVERHAPVVDRVVPPVVAGDVAAPAVDPLAVRVRRRVAVDVVRQEPALRHEEVVGGRQTDVQRHARPVIDVRRQGSPTHVVVRLLPGHPGRSPLLAGDPLPTVVGVVIPAAIVIGRPAVGLVRDPGPAVLGPDPAPVLIGAPGARHVPRRPDPAVPRALDPVPVGGEVVVEEADVHRAAAVRAGVDPDRDGGRGRARPGESAQEDQRKEHDSCCFHRSPRCVSRCRDDGEFP